MKQGLRRWPLALVLWVRFVVSFGHGVADTRSRDCQTLDTDRRQGRRRGVEARWQRRAGHGQRGRALPDGEHLQDRCCRAILANVDAGKLQLDQLVAVDPNDIVPSTASPSLAIHPGIGLSVRLLG